MSKKKRNNKKDKKQDDNKRGYEKPVVLEHGNLRDMTISGSGF